MKKRIINFFMMAALVVAGMGTIASCTDYEEELMATQQQLLDENSTLQDEIAALKAALEQTQSDLTDLDADKDDILDKIQSILDEIESNETSAATQAGKVAALEEEVAELVGMLSGYNEYAAQVTTNTETIITLQNDVETLQSTIATLDADVAQAVADAAKALEQAEKNSDRLALLEEANAALEAEVAAAKAAAEEALALAKEYAQQVIASYDEKIAALETEVTTIGETVDAMSEAVEEMSEQLAALQEQMDSVAATVESLVSQISSLAGLQSCLAQLVTGVIIQSASNAIYGSFSLPVGISSNVLAAYYGSTTSEVVFPTARSKYYVNSDEEPVLTNADVQMLGLNGDLGTITIPAGTMISDDDNNAGTLYVTINPNTVDYTGVTLSLENSQGTACPIELNSLQPSDKLLKFGYTRSTDNGFYEAKAHLSADKINDVKATVDVEELKDVISDVKSYITSGTGLNASSIASSLYNSFSANLDANAACAAWTDANGVEHKVYSNYALAATAIKPLSYGFLADANYTTFPGIGKVSNLINKAFNKVESLIPTNLGNFSNLDFSGLGNFELSFSTDGEYIVSVPISFTVDYSTTITKTITVEIDDTIIVDINQSLEIPVDIWTQSTDVDVETDVTFWEKEVLDTVIVLYNTGHDEVDIENALTDCSVCEAAGSTDDHIFATIDLINKEITKTVTSTAKVDSIHVKDTIYYDLDLSQKVGLAITKYVDVEIDIDISVPVEKTIEVDMTETINDLLASMSGDVQASIDDMLSDLNDYIDTINSLLSKLKSLSTLTDKIDDIESSILSYVTKLNNGLCKIINNVNTVLQPVLLVKTTDSFGLVSQIASAPTVLSGSACTFIPTSYNAEMLCPAYKKLVGVTNVWKLGDTSTSAQNGDAVCRALLRAANSDSMATVLSGGTHKVYASGFKSGYVYEVVYTAVDYSGKVVAEKYYVRVK